MSDGDRGAHLVDLLERDLLVPTPDPAGAVGTCEVVAPEQLLVAMHEDADGLAFPAFTSAEAFLRWRPEGGACASRPGRVVAELAAVDADGRLIVDPGSPSELVVSSAELARLHSVVAAGVPVDAAADLLGGGSPMLVAAPSEPLDPSVVDAIGVALAAVSVVEAAHLVVLDDGTGAPGPIVAVRFAGATSPEAIAEVMPGIVAAVGAAAPMAGGLTFVVVDDAWREAVEAAGTLLFDRR